MSETIEWTKSGKAFGTPSPDDDFYHGRNLPNKHYEMTETWFWNFYEEKSNLHGFIHIWTHPNLKLCTAGIFCHFGHKREQLAAEIFDFRNFTPDEIFDEHGNITLANGLKVTFLEPTQKMRVEYENKDRGFKLDMVQTAVQPAILRAGNQHFEQTMRSIGSVIYDGKEYAFNNLSIRDRSWGENRQEEGHKIPPYTWMNGAFSEDFAFTIAGLDDPRLNPDWAGLYDIPESMLLSDAWIYDHGKKIRLTRLSKITERAKEDGLRPLRTIIDCDTDDGRSFRLIGEVTASLPWHCWQNAMCHCGLTKWTSPQFDNVGWGETQEVQWNDWIFNMAKPV